MKNVRVYMTKCGRLIFTSHLDMNRFMTRALRLSRLPIWYTEGFNPHPYLTFLLPLSLGFESDCEIMDIRITDEEMPLEEIKTALNAVLPSDMQVQKVAEPVLKPGKIAFAEFLITFKSAGDKLAARLSAFLLQDSIVTEKKGKKGKLSTVDLAPKIQSFSTDVIDNEDGSSFVALKIVLPAGGSDNVNPTLLLTAYNKEHSDEPLPFYKIKRTMIFDAQMHPFA